MNTLTTVFIAFGGISLALGALYFYMFARTEERFIQFWGLCWVSYSCSLLFLILGSDASSDSTLFFILRKIFDMLNILFLMFGVYAFPPLKIPGFWHRFSLYLCLWALLAAIYKFDLLSVYIPVSMFQLCMTTMLSYIILKHWEVPDFERLTAIAVFAVWGYGKVIISLAEALGSGTGSLYLSEIIFSNVLNFLVFIIYLQRAQSKLELAENRFRIIAENASDVIFFYDIKSDCISYITPSVSTVFGYSPGDFYGNSRFYMHLADAENQKKLARIFDWQNYKGRNFSEVLQMYTKGSQQIWVEISTTLISEDSQPVALEGIIRNITGMKLAEEQLLASKKSRDTLLSYVSHELKTPIASIIAHASALNDGIYKDESKNREAADIIYRKTLTLERLVRDLFQLSKLENKQFDFEFMMLTGAELADELLGKHIDELRERGLKPSVSRDDSKLSGVYVVADAYRLAQVFTNIAENASRFSKTEGRILINFHLEEDSRFFVFSITNFGPRITAEQLPHIFDRFYRVSHGDPSAKETTSGLGLTISKEIVDAHKGEIFAESDKKSGTKFTVRIPTFDGETEDF
ncbi:MAG: PAS domain-containing sensor histidine kinase [Clostridia bacterium]|nr:PAS domain-containing sensor histidine kinase [Clostridia bacterium]